MYDSGVNDLILFDGDCGLCNRFVLSVIDQDPRKIFTFAPLASPTAQRILSQNGIAGNINSIVLVQEGRAYLRSKAILKILQRLGHRTVAVMLLRLVPTPVADLGYRVVAACRKMFFRQDVCRLMTEDTRSRFAAD